ncbi:MAG: hypothetical protein ACLSVD_13360 [Eggerthellaceae bacterium]
MVAYCSVLRHPVLRLTLANMPVTTCINALPNDMIAHGNAISNTGARWGAVSTALIVTA